MVGTEHVYNTEPAATALRYLLNRFKSEMFTIAVRRMPSNICLTFFAKYVCSAVGLAALAAVSFSFCMHDVLSHDSCALIFESQRLVEEVGVFQGVFTYEHNNASGRCSGVCCTDVPIFPQFPNRPPVCAR